MQHHDTMKITPEMSSENVIRCHASEAVRLLRTTGTALFGAQWKAALARQIGVTRETVSRWCHGAADVPEWAVLFLRELVKARGAVLSLCDRTGIMLEPWAQAGFDCIAVDIRHTGVIKRDGIAFIGAPLLSVNSNWGVGK